MQRDLYSELIAWKGARNRKPLILRGARQVGKTHLLKSFGKKEYAKYIYLNFEEDPKLASFFEPDLKTANILEKISLYFAQDIDPKDTLIIFDEIQESPAALNSLKYFQEQNNEYHIISAGSLLGVKLQQSKGFPVGKVNFLDLYPLNFFEFLDAIGKNKLRNYLRELKISDSIPEPIHHELLSLLKKYMYVGGMPEVVSEYVQTKNLLDIKKIQKEILDAYLLDFGKHAPPEQILKITRIWESIPDQLAKENKKFIFSAMSKSARGREYETAIQWLTDAGLIHKSYNINTPKVPLTGFANKNAFKVFLLDVGLLSAMSNIPVKSVIEDNGLLNEFFGAFTENYTAQELASLSSKLYYWTSEGVAEVDFIIEHELQIFPLEVKAGISRKKKSLLVYDHKYNPLLLLRSTEMNFKKDGKIFNIPLYMIKRVFELCASE